MSWIWGKLFAGSIFSSGFTLKENYKKNPFLTIPSILLGLFLLFLSMKPLVEANTDFDSIETRLEEEKEISNNERLAKAKQESLIDDRYLDSQNGTIVDTTHNLMWKKCTEGLSGETCSEGEATRFEWNNAMNYARDIKYASYSDWRLPTFEELSTIVYCDNGLTSKQIWDSCGGNNDMPFRPPTVNHTVFPKTLSDWYWSSSQDVESAKGAWELNFEFGYSGATYKYERIYIRLVRSL